MRQWGIKYVLSARKVGLLLDLSDSLCILLVCGQTSSDGAGLLGAEVQRETGLALVKQAELIALGLRYDG